MKPNEAMVAASLLIGTMTGSGPSGLICSECLWETDLRGDHFQAHLGQFYAHFKAQHPDKRWMDPRDIKALRTLWGRNIR